MTMLRLRVSVQGAHVYRPSPSNKTFNFVVPKFFYSRFYVSFTEVLNSDDDQLEAFVAPDYGCFMFTMSRGPQPFYSV
jgi:hypothetical protein